ncbi:cytochrome p450 [Colletotrichum tofieldiae]|nr:cytochrome P450 [Colletotrichum tofieldiae]GKT70232.1 cytochrome p450 [Colletotrichum tofieldiae]
MLASKRPPRGRISLIGAGLETTWTLALGSFHISAPQIYAKLQTGLTTAIPDANQVPRGGP